MKTVLCFIALICFLIAFSSSTVIHEDCMRFCKGRRATCRFCHPRKVYRNKRTLSDAVAVQGFKFYHTRYASELADKSRTQVNKIVGNRLAREREAAEAAANRPKLGITRFRTGIKLSDKRRMDVTKLLKEILAQRIKDKMKKRASF